MTEPKLPTLQELAELERLHEAARQGPLSVERRDIDCGYFDYIVHGAKDFAWCPEELDRKAKANATLIAAMRNALPMLLEAARRGMELESALEWLNATYIGGIAMRDMDLSPKSVIAFATGLGFPGLGNKGDGNG